MAEAEEMADRVAILLEGGIVALGTPIQLTATGAGLTKVSVHTAHGHLLSNGHNLPAIAQRAVKEEYAIFYSSDVGRTVTALFEAINADDDTLIDLRVERPSLEDRFLELTNGKKGN
jgi:ABC-2 type transport system ATP-binding protein